MAALGGLLVAAVVIGIGAGSVLAGIVGGAATPVASGPYFAISSPLPGASVTPTPGNVPTAAPAPTPTLAPTPEPTPVVVPAPLTGLPIAESAALQYPIAAMIDDHRDARPQAGFNAAAQVWQAPAESGIPRYMMIFQDMLPASLGPIRSAREYFIDWASEWRAVYIHIGGSPQALSTLWSKGHGQLVYNADGLRFDGSLMWRVKTRAAPHNVYTDAANLLKMGTAVGAENRAIEPVWIFSPGTSVDARPLGTTIVVKYPYETITYRYDTLSNTYLRFIDGSTTPQIDAADERPVAPKNVVILGMQFGPLNDGHPQKHRLEAQDVGKGEAIISSNGRIIHGTWKKAAAEAPTLLFGPDGNPVSLAAGQTFVQVIALAPGYSVDVAEGTMPLTGLGAR